MSSKMWLWWALTFIVVLCTAIAASETLPSIPYPIGEMKKTCKAPSANFGKDANGACACNREEAEFVCEFGCSEEEPRLREMLMPWWDKAITETTFPLACKTADKKRWTRVFVGAIIDGKVHLRCCGPSHDCGIDTDVAWIESAIKQLVSMVKMPNMEFGIFLGDEPAFEKVYHMPTPLFHWISSVGHWEIAFPSPYHERSIEKKYDLVKWDDKIEKAYFRGQLSHPSWIEPTDNHIYMMARMRVLRLAEEHPELFNVMHIGVDRGGSQPEVESAIRLYLQKHRIPHGIPEPFTETLPKHKYLLNLDGVVAAFRMATLLGAGSVVLHQESYTKEYILGHLKPWVHYVPVDYSLSDLTEKIQLLKNNDTLAKEIATNGLKAYHQIMKKSDMWCSMWRTMRSLATLHRHNITEELARSRIKDPLNPRIKFREPFYGNIYRQQNGHTEESVANRLPSGGLSRSPACCGDASVSVLPPDTEDAEEHYGEEEEHEHEHEHEGHNEM